MVDDIGSLVTQLGGAVGSLFTSKGNAAEANSYSSAAQLEEQNAQLTAASTKIQESQTARTVSQSLGTTQADVAGAGFTMSGSALDVLRSSASQGALATSLVNIQGAINENAYAAEAGADTAKAKAANEANTANTVSAIASIGGSLLSGGTQLASAGQTISKGVDYVSGLFNGMSGTGTYVDAAGDSVAANAPGAIQLTADQASQLANGGDLTSILASNTDSAISSTASLGETVASTDTAIDTSGVAIGTSEDAVTAGIGDFLSGAADTVIAGVSDAAASAAAIASGVGDAVVAAGSELADAAMTALACA